MKTLLLVVLLIAASIYAFTTYFEINSTKLKDGTHQVQVVNKFNGKVHVLMGD